MNSKFKTVFQNSRRPRADMLPGNATIRVIIVLAVTAIVALATVVNMMQGDYTNLLIGLAVAGVAAYIGGLWKYSWFATISIGLLGFSISPTSFMIPADFICCGLALGMAVTVLMRRALGSPAPQEVLTPRLRCRGMLVLFTVYFFYVLFQGMAGEMSPVYPGQYSLRNTVKGYAEDMLPVLTLVTLVILRYRMPSMETLAKGVTPAMVGALLALCAYRIWQIAQGRFDFDETSEGFSSVIPIINLIPGDFALRVSSPIAGIWGASRLFAPNERLSKSTWLLNAFLIALALAGSMLSAGRAVPAITLFGVCTMAFLLRRYGFLLITTGGFIVFVCLVNVAGPAIDNMSYVVRRSVAMLRFDQNSDKVAIAGSTAMREFLVDEGMKEVLSKNRILLTGRGVLQFTEGDAAINASKAEFDKWMLAIRTGRLHRTTMSQLVRYGVVGLVLYYLAQLAALVYSFKAYRYFKARRMQEVTFAAFVFTVLAMTTVNGLVQDGVFTNLIAWFVALLAGVVTKQGTPVLERVESPVVDSARRAPLSGGLAARRS